jgi:hypothetical protein
MLCNMRKAGVRRWVGICALVGVVLLLGTPRLPAKDSFVWQPEKNKVAAEITGWDLSELLENIAAATGWQIFVEPDTTRTVTTKFKDRTPGDALKLLLGDLSFALMPQKGERSKLYVFRTTLKEATQLVKVQKAPARWTKPIPDELVITVKPGTDIEALAKKLGAKIVGRADGLNTYRLKFEDAEAASEAREQLKTNSSVESIENNYPVLRPEQPDAFTGGSFAPLNLTPKVVPDANQIIVALIDTAVQPQGTGLEGFFLPSMSVSGDQVSPSNEPTHGTSMSETLLRALSENLGGARDSRVRIQPVDVYGNNPSTTTFQVGQGVLKALEKGPRIVNMSLGSYSDSAFLQKIISSAHSQGVMFFASAGNQPVPYPTFPAAQSEVIAVTAAYKGQLAPYANYGSFVDVIAPGTVPVNFNNRSWVVSGTSASSAWMAGYAAGMFDVGGKAPTQIESTIRTQFRFSNGR